MDRIRLCRVRDKFSLAAESRFGEDSGHLRGPVAECEE